MPKLTNGRLPDEVRELIEGRNFAHLATVSANGAPHSVVLWIDMEGDRIAFFTQPTSIKGRNLEREPRVAISIVDSNNPYRSARIQGRVVERIDGPPAKAVADRISMSYKGKPFRKPTTSLYLVEPTMAGYLDLTNVS